MWMKPHIFFCYFYLELSEKIIIFVIDKLNAYEDL